MPPLKDQAKIEAMRRRLYERGRNLQPESRHELLDEGNSVIDSWSPKKPLPNQTVASAVADDPRPGALTTPQLTVISPIVEPKRKWFHSYRMIILLATLLVFLLVLGGTSVYLLVGSNQISNKNIAINITGPLTIPGGEIMPLQVTLANQNKIPIE